MTSNIILPLSLIARSILFVLCNTEAAIEAASLKKWGGCYFPFKVLKTPHTPKIEKKGCLTDLGLGIGTSKCMLLALITDYHGLTVAILKPQLSDLRSF